MSKKCIFTFCENEQGAGTWTQIGESNETQPVCEEHWQALRSVRPGRTRPPGEPDIRAAVADRLGSIGWMLQQVAEEKAARARQ